MWKIIKNLFLKRKHDFKYSCLICSQVSEFLVRFENTLKQVLGNLQISLGHLDISLAISLGSERHIKSHLHFWNFYRDLYTLKIAWISDIYTFFPILGKKDKLCYNLKFIDNVPMVISSSSFSIHQLNFFNSLRCQFWAPRTQVYLYPNITWAADPI